MCYDSDAGDYESDFDGELGETDSECDDDLDNDFEIGLGEYDPDVDIDAAIEVAHEHDEGREYDLDLERDMARETAYEDVWDLNQEPDFDQIAKDGEMEGEIENRENTEPEIEYSIAPKTDTGEVSSIDTSYKIDQEEDLAEYEITSRDTSEIDSMETRTENEDEMGHKPEIGIEESHEYRETWDPEEDEVGAALQWDVENEAEANPELNLGIDPGMNEEIDYEFKTDSDLEIDMDDLEPKENSGKTEHDEKYSELHRDSKIEFYESAPRVEYKEEEDDDEIKKHRKGG